MPKSSRTEPKSAAGERLQLLKNFIREGERHIGSKMEKIEMGPAAIADIRKELGLGEAEQITIDGVLIVPFDDPRTEQYVLGSTYAKIRWGISMSPDDVKSLLKAVPTEELMALIPIIVDQHMDDHGYKDPVDAMDSHEVDDMKKSVTELGFEEPQA